MSEAKYTLEENGNISTPNLSAYWIPEITLHETIHGTAYTVTGSYEGITLFTRKLERIMARKLVEEIAVNTEEQEEADDDRTEEI